MKKQKEEMTQLIINSMPGIVFWKSSDLQYLGANQQFLKFFGLDHLNQLIGKKDEELACSLKKQDYLRKCDLQLMLTKQPQLEIQENFLDKDGKLITLSTDKYPIYNSDNQIIGILCISSITDSKDSAVQTYLENIIASVPYYIFWKDLNSVYLGCNQKFSSLVNKTPKEVIGKTDLELGWKGNEAKVFTEGDKAVMSGNPKVNVEETLLQPDGSETIMLVSKVPVLDSDGSCMGILGVSIDITDRKKIEAALKSAKEAAESANKAKAEFIANMSHDIRTPLSGIVGMSKLLEENALNEQERQYARWVNESGNQLLNLLNDVLDVISADNIQEGDIREESFNLYQNIEDIGRLELAAMQAKDIEFIVDIDKHVPRYIVTDKTKFHRILLNLLGNAIKFTEKGSIYIHVKRLTQKNGVAKLEVSVEDTGIGIPDEIQAHLFDQFFRGDPSYNGIYRGHGLGLHIAQRYVALLNGELKLTSRVGKGSRFYFTLPVKVCDGEMIKAEENSLIKNPINDIKASPIDKANKINGVVAKIPTTDFQDAPHLLLIEDNNIALRLLETLVYQTGCRFHSVKDGESALKLVKSIAFDLIVSDIGLPGMSGIELTHYIREWEKSFNKKAVPIVGLTAHALNESTNRCLQAGMNKVLQKPIKPNELKAVIKQFVKSLDKESISQPPKTVIGLGLDLPETEVQLFQLDSYPLLDIDNGIKNMGNEQLLRELLMLMVNNELPKDENTIKQAYSKKKWDLVENLAHKIKSGAVYCGTVKMQYACQYLERYRKAGHSYLLDKLYHQLIQVIGETKISITDWLKSNS